MKKIYTILSVIILSTMTFTASAANGALGKGIVINPEFGQYTQWFPTLVELEWKNSYGNPEEINFATIAPIVNVQINSTNGAIAPKLISGDGNSGIGGLSTRAGAGVGITIDIADLYALAGNPQTGTLTITIPANLVESTNGDTNEAQTIEYNVMQQYPDSKISITPTPYITTPPTNLSNVSLTFDGELTVVNDNPVVKVNENLANGGVENYTYTGEIKVYGNSINLDLSYLTEGSYTLIIPAGYVLIDNNMINGEIWFGYNIFEGMASAQILQAPGKIAAAGFLPPVMLTWDYQIVSPTEEGLYANISGYDSKGEEVSFDVPVSAFSFAIIDKPSGEPGTPSTGTRTNDSGNVLIIDYTSLLGNLTGNFTLTIPEGIVVDANGKVNPLEEIIFGVYKYADELANISVENNLITISWPGFFASSPAEDAPLFITDYSGKRTNLSTYDTFTDKGEIYIDYSIGIFAIDLESLNLENSSYTLCIPEYCVLLNDDDYNTFVAHEQYYDFEVENGQVSGIEGLQSEIHYPVAKGVFNLQGVKVADEPVNLPDGIFIINGKKVLIRK